MPFHFDNRDYEGRYSPDRVSLAQEIRDTLTSRGYKVPPDWASSDLIGAVASALDEGKAAIELMAIGS